MASDLEAAFRTLWRQLGGPELEAEAVLIPGRRWRVDFACRPALVAFEVEGGMRGRPIVCHACGARVQAPTASGPGRFLMQYGRHATGPGASGDIAKYNTLTLAGYAVLRVTAADLDVDPAGVLEPMIAFVRGRLSDA